MTHSLIEHSEHLTNDTMSKLVGALLLELADDVPDLAGLETVKADLLAASKTYETGKKQDLALRFYLATRALFHELERREKEAAKSMEPAKSMEAAAGSAMGHGPVHHDAGNTDSVPPSQQER
jgi:hypothetical protein